jgi:hypothetical protein
MSENNNAPETFVEKVEDVVEGAINTITEFANDAVDKIKAVAEDIKDAITGEEDADKVADEVATTTPDAVTAEVETNTTETDEVKA